MGKINYDEDCLLQEDERQWNEVWEREGALKQIVNYGRILYNKFFFKLLLKKVSKKSDIVELGCGTSLSILSLYRHVNSITGVDISNRALAISRQNAKRNGIFDIRLIRDDCRKLKLKDGSFDLVWSQGLIEHFDNPTDIIKQHIRICKNSGFIIIGVPAKYSFFSIWYFLSSFFGIKKLWPWTKQGFYTKKNLLDIMKNLDYDIRYGIRVYKLMSLLGILILEVKKDGLVTLNRL